MDIILQHCKKYKDLKEILFEKQIIYTGFIDSNPQNLTHIYGSNSQCAVLNYEREESDLEWIWLKRIF